MTMDKNKILKNSIIKYLIISIIFSFVLPLVFKLFKISIVFCVGLLFLIVNSILSVWMGIDISKNNRKWYFAFIFPIMFTIMIIIFFAPYNLFFGLIYLLLIYISTGIKGKMYEKNKN